MGIMDTFTGNNAGEELRTAGTAFADSMRALPIGDMVTNVAMGIAKAQSQLDRSSIELLEAYASHTVDMWGTGDATQEVSILSLGLVPSFFTFSRVNIKIVMELTFHEEQSNQASIGASLNYETEAVAPATQNNDPVKEPEIVTESAPAQEPAPEEPAPAQEPSAPAPAPNKKSSFAAGGAVSVSSARKFAIDMSGLAEVNAEMISVPAPTAVLESITKYLTASAPN